MYAFVVLVSLSLALAVVGELLDELLPVKVPNALKTTGTVLIAMGVAWGLDYSVFTAFHSMSEDNLRMQLAVPWVGVCSDAASIAPVGRSLDSPTHPRAYGSFARVLGHYTRELGVLTLPEAIRRMTSLPASTFGLTDRGVLEPGHAADLVVLDPERVADRATFAEPHQLSVGVRDVLVNGVLALRDGEPTGARPGRALRRGRGPT